MSFFTIVYDTHTLGATAGGSNAADADNATITEEHGPRATEGQFLIHNNHEHKVE